MSGAALPGVVAVARRRALIAESELARLARGGADADTLIAARRLMDERFAELASIEAAEEPAGRETIRARGEFAAERARALTAPQGEAELLLLFHRWRMIAADGAWSAVRVLRSAGGSAVEEAVLAGLAGDYFPAAEDFETAWTSLLDARRAADSVPPTRGRGA
ncbi:hypothetical protein [Frankia sp. KB5]|uniref:hypothetical protein n=1 Tax=Frankia sp. KB5 TaxID=683318 RepID=UPI000A0FE8D5|nr:hypothetical protein [Frankia sp. KB5]ORT48495.1 hypothetical protein KBI5_15450 [Frankia sp. KB5]